LRRQFRADTGTSWQEYRTTSRVLRAMAMLAEDDRTVLDASVAVGFESLSGFNRAFRRLTGERPNDYRRRIRSDR
jgi:AraC-like DNA-binding protein